MGGVGSEWGGGCGWGCVGLARARSQCASRSSGGTRSYWIAIVCIYNDVSSIRWSRRLCAS